MNGAVDNIPETGAIFTLGRSKFADNIPSCFWLKNDKVQTVSCGDEHTALLTASGKIYVFGANDWGQLGLGHTLAVNKPTCIKSLKHCKGKYLTCGRTHTLVYTSNNEIYAFGNNNDAQLGSFEKSSYNSPVSFNTSDWGKIKQIDAGADFSVALTMEGKLYVWGSNAEGQLGLGPNENEIKTPTLLNFDEEIIQISCGYYHTAFCTKSGKLYTFGENEYKLGKRSSNESCVPSLVDTQNIFVLKVECGSSHTVFISKDRKVYVFGDGSHGQLGLGPNKLQVEEPTCIARLGKHKIVNVCCGDNFTAIITASGKMYTFGDGRHGKLGLGEENFTNQFKPYRCSQFSKYFVYQASCGGCHLIVLANRREESSFVSSESEMEDPMQSYQSGFNAMRTINGDTITENKTINLGRTLSAREKRRQVRQTNLLSQTLPPLKTIPKSELINAAKSLPENDKASTLPLPKARSTKPKETDTISEISQFNKVHILKQNQPGEIPTLQPIKPPRKNKPVIEANISQTADNKPNNGNVQFNGTKNDSNGAEDINSSQGEDSTEEIPIIDDGASTSKVDDIQSRNEEDELEEGSEYETEDDDEESAVVETMIEKDVKATRNDENNKTETDKEMDKVNDDANHDNETKIEDGVKQDETKKEVDDQDETNTTVSKQSDANETITLGPKPKKKWFSFGRSSKDKKATNTASTKITEGTNDCRLGITNPQPSGSTNVQDNPEPTNTSNKQTSANTKQSKLCNIL